MKKLVSKVVSLLLLAALLVSPVVAAAPERVVPPTDEFGLSAEDELWLETARMADSFTVQLKEPSLATYEGSNALFAMPARTERGKLDFEAPETIAYLDYINSKLDAFISDAETVLGRELEVLYRYDVVLNGFSAKMSLEEAAQLRQLPEVLEVYPDEIWQIDTDVSPAFIGIDQIWNGNAVPGDAGAKGAGTIVGIIDTGINMTHPSFQQTTPLDPYVYPAPAGGFKGLCKTDPAGHVCNNKLIGVWDMLNNNNGHDQLDHGSHTAGTAAGNRVQINYNGASVVISGMAPNAQVLSYKVCSSSGCPSSASTAAVNQAIIDGADALNFSIGPTSGPARSPWMDTTEKAFLEAFKVGVSTATSAGNSGPGASTIYKTPPWAAVVGNTGHGRIFGYPVTINPASDNLGSVALYASDDLSPALTQDLTNKDLVWGGSSNNKLGCDPWAAGALTGKVGIVQRGDCSFKDKLQNMFDAGAVFGLVYNNQPGAPIIMGTNTGFVNMPAGMISLEDGLAMEAVAGAPMKVTILKTGTSGTKPDWGDIMADHSSRGPVTTFEILQPDLVAPGTNVLAPYGGPGNVSDLMSGTSMAGPHVAGSMATMRSLFPTWSPAAIRSAIIMTTKAGVTRDHDMSVPTPFVEGNGRIDMSKAALSGLVMEVSYDEYIAANPADGGNPQTLNIPSYQNSNCLGGCTFERTVTNITNLDLDYQITIDKTENVEITVQPAGGFTIPAGGTQKLTVTVKPSVLSGGAWQFGRIILETDGIFANGKPVSASAFTLAAKAPATGSTLPSELRINTAEASGQYVFEEVYNSEAITAFNTTRFGLTPATTYNFSLAQDPTRGDPFDDVSQVWYTTTTCPTNQQRMVVEVLETTATDLDVFVGTGNTPVEALLKAYSANPGSMEYLNIFQPTFSGTCWIMVQNWEASEPGVSDPVKLAVGFVPKTPTSNYTVTAPNAVPKLEPFDMTVEFTNLPFFDSRDVWYGWFSVGSSATKKDDVGKLDFNVYKGAPETPVLDKNIYFPVIYIVD
ncbi:MAG TPA: S8 family serine peptidase [Anaerolineaceae bacterium]|nr:S8 family serine peptidase [Anaerolineaceae bacterium]